MANKSAHISEIRRYGFAARCRAAIALIGSLYVGGCSLADFNYLTAGDSGGVSSAGGVSNAGGLDTGGFNSGGTSARVSIATPTGGSGGVAQGGTTASQGGTTTAQGGTKASQGGTKATTVTTNAGGSAATSCIFTGTGGRLLTPPSQSFESNADGWITQSGNVSALSRVQGSTDSCEGAWYLTVDGTQRTASWDGPAFSVLPYVVPGNTYEVSVAVRLRPSNSLTTTTTVTLVAAKKCVDTSVAAAYQQLINATGVTVNWVRLTGTFTASMTGCSSLSTLTTYLDIGDSTSPYASVDIDDYKFLDVTVGSTGTGGTSGMGGSSSAAAGSGTGGTSGMGGSSSAAAGSGTGGTSGMGGNTA